MYQFNLFSQDDLTANFVPKTKIFSIENLLEFLKSYEFVYIKHDKGGQGKGIYKVYQDEHGNYNMNGYTPKGKKLNIPIASIEDFDPEKYPNLDFKGRFNSGFIVQEGINSITLNGDPLAIRVHVQKLNEEWLVTGMYGKISTAETYENGIVNANQGAQVMAISDLLYDHLGMDEQEKMAFLQTLEKISVTAVKLVSVEYPRLEYGIDFGINSNADPILFEVNTYPGIGNFAKVENREILNKIYRIRKMQKEEAKRKDFLV
ncbi:YheC/YheD family protein [Lederbergia panacisoli]|uniref:YheC/YheD family protein n=1 Tax=Lederbergia panacisoli TaxID=1255251 RepID=UPI00214AE8DC|nr:YheC/YheD family protein [Lederbergia panacisoli]MCR2821649.1 YheC/YheD family protein [Lederbergia panacisoli]